MGFPFHLLAGIIVGIAGKKIYDEFIKDWDFSSDFDDFGESDKSSQSKDSTESIESQALQDFIANIENTLISEYGEIEGKKKFNAILETLKSVNKN
ncbi:hypothetical protein CCY99_03570 [Helicobacter sp. 16-1353]|uniref:hypothetical protein n=1 Tax=Helicobacter sp. 16-1353 TaxID=2004996 RepID=UPI000DCB0D3E|nr:hypothetical protein [Helicobacter sp. 16-1353]RAX54439.1 hypothetical protein CCY99_03570 [Helicobacter sp. 16-1353]